MQALVRDLGVMIDAARKQVASTGDATLAKLYWHIGHHARTDVLEGRRASCNFTPPKQESSTGLEAQPV